jgi:hypothetical protein
MLEFRRPMTRGRLSKTTAAAAVCVSAAIWTSFGLLAVTSADSARRIGVLPSPWLLPLLIVAVLGLFAAIGLSSRASLPLFLSALIVVPWLPVPLPEVLLAWTGPAVLLVWGAIALCLAAIHAPAIAARTTWPHDPRVAPIVAAMFAFAIFLAVRLAQRLPPTGDEPHYLVITQSLLSDRDVAVGNNYERLDYNRYYAGFLEPHASVAGDGKAYSVHSPGLPALVAPAFALGGYWPAVIWIALLSAAGTALVWKSAYLLTEHAGAAWFGWAAVTLTAPCALLGSLIYPDPVSGCILAGGVLALVLANQQCAWPVAGSLALGTAIGVLPWLHTRLTVPAGTLGALVLLHLAFDRAFHTNRWRHLAAFVAPCAIVVAGWFGFFWTIHHTLSPVAAYGNVVPLELRRIGPGLLGLLADQEFGLLANAPIHLVSFAGIWFVFRRHARLGLELLLLVLPYSIAVSAYDLWWGGFSPPGRFLVPLVFVGGVGAACVWDATAARGRAVSATLLGVSILTAAVLSFGGGGALAYNTSTGRARWLDWVSPLVDLPRAFPSFFRGASPTALEWSFAWPVLLWTAVLLAAWMIFALVERRLSAASAVRVIAAPACLTLACVAGVAASWNVRGDVRLMATRAQLDLLRGEDRRLRPFGVQPFPAAGFPADQVAPRLSLSTSRLESPSPHTLLFLPEVPPGSYRVRLKRRPNARGQIVLGVGRATMPFAQWSLTDDPNDRFPFDLVVHASSLVVNADDDAARSVDEVTLVPARRSKETPTVEGRARDAARYGSSVVYALDDRIWLEPGGFWVSGERQPDVIVATDQPVGALQLEALNGPIVNRLRISAGAWSSDHRLAPDERWPIRVPAVGPRQAFVVNFDVERGFRAVDVDPQSRDHRYLGCWIAVR